MPLAPPRTLSPSKVSSFKDCALAFRFSVIDKVPEPPSLPASRGTLVHAALERLFGLVHVARTPEAAAACLATAWDQLRTDPEFTGQPPRGRLVENGVVDRREPSAGGLEPDQQLLQVVRTGADEIGVQGTHQRLDVLVDAIQQCPEHESNDRSGV